MNTTTAAVEHFVSKLGTAKGVARSRIWIEGDRLVRQGFTVGRRFDVTIARHAETGATTLYLTLEDDGARKVSGKGDKPIIDITGECVRGWFPESAAVAVTYGLGVITIQGA